MKRVLRNSAWLAFVLVVATLAFSLAGCASVATGAPAIRGISVQIVGPSATTSATGAGATAGLTTVMPTGTAGTTPTATQRVAGADVMVTVSLLNFQLVTATGQANAAGQGHLNYFLDDLPVSLMGTGMTSASQPGMSNVGMVVSSSALSYTFRNVSPGQHLFAVQLVNNNNTALSTPAAAAALLFVVVPGATTATPTMTTTPTTTTTATTTATGVTATTTRPTTTIPTATGATTVPTATGATTVTLTALNNTFNPTLITVPPGANVTVRFNNMDTGVVHNFAVYSDQTTQTPIFIGQPFMGPGIITYQFTAPATRGLYFFRCDFHPATMFGTLSVQ